MEASPHTMAGSSSPALSPCSSTNLRSTSASAAKRCWTHLGGVLSHWSDSCAQSQSYNLCALLLPLRTLATLNVISRRM